MPRCMTTPSWRSPCRQKKRCKNNSLAHRSTGAGHLFLLKNSMKIAIVGAGIIGVTTAWELVSDGHEVSVFERRGAAAEESSFANAGVVAPGYVTPWAAPGMRAKVLRSLLSPHGAIKLRWPLNSRDLGWMSRWQKACKLETYLANRARMQRLAFYSRTRL